MIKSPAILCKGKIYIGRTHVTISDNYNLNVFKDKYEDGFITDDNKFVNRFEAAKIAFDCGQIKEKVWELKSYHIKK